MPAQFSRRRLTAVAVLMLTSTAAPAWAQQQRDVQLPPVEVRRNMVNVVEARQRAVNKDLFP